MWYNYYAKKGLFHLLEKEKITMKIAKRVLSIVMSLIMIFGVCAVVTVSAAENPTLDIANYDSNYVLCWDEYIREYNYGTGMTAAWPRQVSFNEYGWMRIRSQTPEEIAAGEPGHYEHQWQYAAKITPEFDAAFKAGMAGGAYDNTFFNMVVYLKEGRVAHPGGYMDKFTGELQLDFTFKPDFDGDGLYGETEEGEDALNITKGQIFSPMTNADFIEAMIPVGDLIGWIDEGIDYKFTTLGINFQNYQHGKGQPNSDGKQGMGEFDVFISPGYNGDIPGLPKGTLPSDVSSFLDTSDSAFKTTFNKDEFLWTSQDPELANPEDDALTCFGLGNTQKDENGYPILKTGAVIKSEPVSYKGPTIIPDQVTGIKATNVTATSVTLSWNAAKNAESYKINETGGKVTVPTTKETSITITGLKPGTSYTFRVRGINGANSGKYSTNVTVTTPAAVKKPSTPKISSATVTAYNKITVKWGKTTNAKYYNVERKIGSGSYKTIKSLTTATSFVDTTSTAGTYTYRVTAVASDKKTKSSASATKAVKAIGTAKPTIKKLTPAKKAMTVALKAKVTNATGYEIQVATNKKFTKGKKTLKTTKLTAKVTKLTSKKTYYVRVRAYQKVGKKTYYGKWSAVKSAKVK